MGAVVLGLVLVLSFLSLVAAQEPESLRHKAISMPDEMPELTLVYSRSLQTQTIRSQATNPSVKVDEAQDCVNLSTTPGTTITVTVYLSDGVTSKISYTIDDCEYCVLCFVDLLGYDYIAPTDIVEVLTDSVPITVSVAGVTAIDYVNHVITGVAQAGRYTVTISYAYEVTDACKVVNYWTQTVTPTASDTFTAIFTDAIRGTHVSVSANDADGNGTDIFYRSVPIVDTTPRLGSIQGYVGKPYSPVTATLFDSNWAEVETITDTAQRDGQYGICFAQEMIAGDTVVVTSTTEVMSVTIVPLKVSIRSGSNLVTGQGPANSVLKVEGTISGTHFCQTATTSSNSLYTITFPLTQTARARDTASVQYTNVDEHILRDQAEILALYLPMIFKNY